MSPQCVYCPCDHVALWIRECCLGGKLHLEINENLQIEGMPKTSAKSVGRPLGRGSFSLSLFFLFFIFNKKGNKCVYFSD